MIYAEQIRALNVMYEYEVEDADALFQVRLIHNSLIRAYVYRSVNASVIDINIYITISAITISIITYITIINTAESIQHATRGADN